jgi:hypothetical protein
VSADGVTLAAAWRDPTTLRGIRAIVGEYHGAFLCACQTVAAGTNLVKWCTIPDVRVAALLPCEAGLTNAIQDPNESVFAAGVGRWTNYGSGDIAAPPVSVADATSPVGGHAARFTVVAGTNTYGIGLLAKGTGGGAWPTGMNGDKVVVSCWVKNETLPWGVSILAPYGYSVTNITGLSSMYHYAFPPAGAWRRMILEGVCSADGARVDELGVRINKTSGQGGTFLIAGFELHYLTGAWRSTDSVAVAGTPRTNESATLTLGSLPSSGWAVRGYWKPQNGWGDFPTNDVAIASVKAAATHIDIFWDASEKKLTATDGTHTIASAVLTWRHFDGISWLLTYNGTEASLHIAEPILGAVTVDGTGVGVTMGAPTSVVLGANAAGDLFSCGLHGGVEAYSGTVDPDAVVLATPSDITVTYEGVVSVGADMSWPGLPVNLGSASFVAAAPNKTIDGGGAASIAGTPDIFANGQTLTVKDFGTATARCWGGCTSSGTNTNVMFYPGTPSSRLLAGVVV